MSRKVKTFFHAFLRSLIPNPTYYQRIIKTRFSFSLKYFIFLIFVVNLIFSTLFLARNKEKISYIIKTVSSAIQIFPEDLKLYIRDGSLMTNYDIPYFLWLDRDKTKELFLVIDETALGDDIHNYDAKMLLANKSFIMKRPDGGIKQFSLRNINTTIDKEKLTKLNQIFENYFFLVAVGIAVFSLLIIPLIKTIHILLILLFVSAVSYIIYALFDQRHYYLKTLQLSIHAATLPIVVFYIVMLVDPIAANNNALVAFILLTLIFSLCALYEGYLDRPVRSRHSSLPRRR